MSDHNVFKLAQHAMLQTKNGLQRLVRHVHLPEREVMTGIGLVGVRQPRVRDRQAPPAERVRFRSSILLPYARRSKSLEVLIPILHLKGISTDDFAEALSALVGKEAPGLIPPRPWSSMTSSAIPSREWGRHGER